MSDLPTGAVTFLFTDIEGSTQLVKQLRERYTEALALHQALLSEAFERHDGHEIDTQGDSFFVACANARGAVLVARSSSAVSHVRRVLTCSVASSPRAPGSSADPQRTNAWNEALGHAIIS